MSSYDRYRRLYETPADILYCPCCAASSNNWEKVYYSRHYDVIVGCDACARSDEGDDEHPEKCPVCGKGENKARYIVKATGEVLGCEDCIIPRDYDECEYFHREEML